MCFLANLFFFERNNKKIYLKLANNIQFLSDGRKPTSYN